MFYITKYPRISYCALYLLNTLNFILLLKTGLKSVFQRFLLIKVGKGINSIIFRNVTSSNFCESAAVYVAFLHELLKYFSTTFFFLHVLKRDNDALLRKIPFISSRKSFTPKKKAMQCNLVQVQIKYDSHIILGYKFLKGVAFTC